MSQETLIEDLVDSKLSTKVLEEMLRTTKAMTKNLKVLGSYPVDLFNWEARLGAAVSIRRGMNE